jgi:Flp pilus assembly protein TadG
MKHSWKRKRKGKEKGQSLTEMALVLPVILVVLAGVLDLGRLYYVTVALTDAAGEGATYAALNPNNTDEIIARTQSATGGLVQVGTEQVTVDCPSVTAGSTVTVSISYDFTVATPLVNLLVPDGVVTLQGVASEIILTGGM